MLFFLFVPDDLDILFVLALAVPPLAVHDGCVHIGRGEGVGLIQKRYHTEQDRSERDINRRGKGLKYKETHRKTEEQGGREDGGKMRHETAGQRDVPRWKERREERKRRRMGEGEEVRIGGQTTSLLDTRE